MPSGKTTDSPGSPGRKSESPRRKSLDSGRQKSQSPVGRQKMNSSPRNQKGPGKTDAVKPKKASSDREGSDAERKDYVKFIR